MNPWIVLLAIVVLAALYVLVPVGAATLAHYRRPRRLACPVAGTEAAVEIDAREAALAEVMGGEALHVTGCSRWPAWGCRQQCVDEHGTSAAEGAAPVSAAGRTILVPLDGTPESEAVLPGVEAIAKREHARLRLLRVSPPPPAVMEGGRIIAYADQETARVELEEQVYLRFVAQRMPGVPVERAVRFGETVTEILAEADQSGADLIAMAMHDRAGLARLRWGSVTDAVARATRIPVIRVPIQMTAAS